MKQTARILSTYSADTTRVCSEFYELCGIFFIFYDSGSN